MNYLKMSSLFYEIKSFFNNFLTTQIIFSSPIFMTSNLHLDDFFKINVDNEEF
jgi:hypothetical protein